MNKDDVKYVITMFSLSLVFGLIVKAISLYGGDFPKLHTLFGITAIVLFFATIITLVLGIKRLRLRFSDEPNKLY